MKKKYEILLFFEKLKNNGRITYINPYKRKDVELNQQTRVENGEKKILIFDTTKWSGSKTKHALIPLIGPLPRDINVDLETCDLIPIKVSLQIKENLFKNKLRTH